MNEEIKTAETTTQVEANENAVVDKAEESKEVKEVNDIVFSDTEKPKQTAEQNSENARRRREAEKQAELKSTREKAIIETLKGKNPYTNEEMKDSADVEEYLAMREIEDNGGDPIGDYPKFSKEKKRQADKEQAEKDTKQEWFKKDRESFKATYPDVDLSKLIEDKYFQSYANGKVGNMPMTEIYNGFVELLGQFDEKAKKKASQLYANAKATPSALASPTNADSGTFTREQVAKMSQEEVHQNYDKIRESMKNWK